MYRTSAGALAALFLVSCWGDSAVSPPTPDTVCETADDGTSCDDRDACTALDSCEAGRCVGHDPMTCAPPAACRSEGRCEPTTGRCRYPLAPDGNVCDDGDACTEIDECRLGVCLGTVRKRCKDADDCGGAGRCDRSTGECHRNIEPDGTACDDHDACTLDDSCRNGACVPGEPIVCTADGPCRTVMGCAPDVGCVYADLEREPCDDGDACTANDHCISGVCTSTFSMTCEALDGCHNAGFCDSRTGCTNPPKPDGTFCDDGQLCTVLAACQMGVCTASVAAECPMSPSICLANGQCNPSTGQCFFPPLANGTGCNDDNVCTANDVCAVGRCVGTRIPTSVQPCSDDVCFTTVTATAGISFTSTASIMMGAGAAFLDFDGDGSLDLALGSEGRGVQLFSNVGTSFVDVTATSGLTPLPSGDLFMGFAVADYDNDGDDDIYLAVRGTNRLYRNDSGVFVDVTTTAGVGDSRWSTGAAFGDYDSDGDLDLYVGNYVQVVNFPNHTPFPNTLYRNDGGTFTDVTNTLGVAGAGTTLAVLWTDYDDDGDRDLFVCNDFGAYIEPNRLYRNDGGRFVEVGRAMNFDIGIFCMGIAAADYDNDLDLDYYFTNLGRNVFLRNDGTAFVDVTDATQTTLTTDQCRAPLLTTSWGIGFVDFDRDGAEELYVSNGYIPAAGPIANAPDSPNALLRVGVPSADISVSGGIDDRQVGRGVAFGDYDNDGDVDIVQANVVGSAVLYRNDAPSPGNFIGVDLFGRLSSRDPFGARVRARTSTITRSREYNANFGFESSSAKRLHFGLGSAPLVDELTVRWPSGVRQSVFDVPSGMIVALTEPLVIPMITDATPSPVSTGQTLAVTADLTNHSSGDVIVNYAFDLWNGGVVTAGSVGSRLVGAFATVTVIGSVSVPTGASGPSSARVTLSESGSVAQAERAVTVGP